MAAFEVETQSRTALQALADARQRDPAGAMQDLVAKNVASQSLAASLAEFLRTLTDPCVRSRDCLARRIPRPDEAPDEHQLNAVDRNGRPL